MRLRSILLSFSLLVPVFMFADISGKYKVTGFDPDRNQIYTGKVEIDQVGSVFTATWTFDGGGTDTGTGVKKGTRFHLCFTRARQHQMVFSFMKLKNII